MAAPSSVIVSTYTEGIRDLATLAFKDLVDLVGSSRGRGPEVVKRTLQENLPAIVDQYGIVAADLAAEYFQESRLSAGVTTRFAPAPTDWKVSEGRVESLIRWGVAPEFNQSASTTETLIGGGLQRLIYNGFRGTVVDNTQADRTAYGYARKPKPGCCAFCAMLATRVYESKETALKVVGVSRSAKGYRKRADGEYKQVKRRESGRELGQDYHDFCRCSTVPVFRTGEYVDEWEDVQAVNPEAEKYVEAYAAARNSGTGKTSDVLSRMRKEHGFAR